jgi:import inner membrane translocase subunit TIM9|eukprot:scaffold8671_cov210-Chaetoceros_neogracile.AAC.2
MDVTLEPHLQKQLQQNVINSTMKQNVDLMSKIADQCFNECVNHFPSKMLSKNEAKCIEHCADRFIVLSQRVGKKYQEVQHQVVVKEKLKLTESQQKQQEEVIR